MPALCQSMMLLSFQAFSRSWNLMSVFIDDQLSRGVEHARVLVLIGVVDLNLACGQVVSYALSVVKVFTESELAVCDEANLAAGFVGTRRI